MKRIPVTPSTFAIVDSKLYAQLAALGSWNLVGRGYARCYVRGSGAKNTKYLYMHCAVLQLLGKPAPIQVDHRNRNKLDNRSRNLRSATNSLNNAHRPKQNNNQSGFRGVSRVTRAFGPRWRAEICKDGKRQHLGCFSTPERAARVYDKAAVQLFGNFAFLNFPTGED